MASTVACQKPAVNYFSLSTQNLQNTTVSPLYGWDSSPYTDPAIVSDDSILTSPTSPESLTFPDYSFAKQEVNPTIKSEQAFDFGTFEDWMRWDDSTDAALSPTSDFFPGLKTEPQSPNMNRLELQGSGVGSSNGIDPSRITDESAIFGEDPISEEPLFQTPAPLSSSPMTVTEVPPREGLYSTPLSWSRPSLGQSMQSFNGMLSPQQELKLRDIAMPSNSQPESYPTSPTSVSSPEPCENNRRKRKSSVEDDDDEEDSVPTNRRHPPVKKTAHNMIEKRYRTNLNDKIAALRDSVPSLRVMSKKNSRGGGIQEDLQGLTPAHKLNKATVLSKATEYIAHLEKRNKYLTRENAALKSRVDAFEILVMSRQPQPQQVLQPKQQQQRNSMVRQGEQSWMG